MFCLEAGLKGCVAAGMWFQLALFYNEREMMLAYTVVSTASSLSGVVGAPIAASLLTLDGRLGLHGWQVGEKHSIKFQYFALQRPQTWHANQLRFDCK